MFIYINYRKSCRFPSEEYDKKALFGLLTMRLFTMWKTFAETQISKSYHDFNKFSIITLN